MAVPILRKSLLYICLKQFGGCHPAAELDLLQVGSGYIYHFCFSLVLRGSSACWPAGNQGEGLSRRSLQDVFYIAKNRADKRSKVSILQGISGFFNPGEMAAVMGPSGSGGRQSYYSLL